MKGFVRADLLFSLCGLNCGLCVMHLDGRCPGCGGGEGNQACKIARCSLQHGGLEYCSECREFPCDKYEHIDAFDSFITHQNRKKDLLKRQKTGTESYRSEQQEKVRMLNYLLEKYNDGRRKTFFCLAVNLLELDDLKAALQQAEEAEAFQGLSLKEQASRVVKQLQSRADEQGILLKLRKKK